MTEEEMRDSKVPYFTTKEELDEYVNSLINQNHDYGTAVYAISLSATAMFNYVACKMGASGFQASCADLDVLRRIRGLEGPFMIIKLDDALYPQYDLHGRLQEFIDENRDYLKDAAKKQLENASDYMHVDVRKHMERIANA